jgi:hypothetical protein
MDDMLSVILSPAKHGTLGSPQAAESINAATTGIPNNASLAIRPFTITYTLPLSEDNYSVDDAPIS